LAAALVELTQVVQAPAEVLAAAVVKQAVQPELGHLDKDMPVRRGKPALAAAAAALAQLQLLKQAALASHHP
jgi:hypothetical protein